MSRILEINIVPDKAEYTDIIIALLSDIDYHGFEERGHALAAFISEELFDEALLRETLKSYSNSFTHKLIPDENWNALWESEYDPVTIDDFVTVRAIFHSPSTSTLYDLLITPKMSFGTAHHPTTFLMIRQMKDVVFTGKSILDFGTGTGVLAILAAKMGAKKLVAIDLDDYSIENAKENILVNGVRNIDLRQQDSINSMDKFDIILANINLNVIMLNLNQIHDNLLPGGKMILSGFLEPDANTIIEAGNRIGLTFQGKTEREGWMCIELSL